jgi:hypothetical protein
MPNPMPSAAQPFVDPRTGIVSSPWQQWLAGLPTDLTSAGAWNDVATTVGYLNGWSNFGSIYRAGAYRTDGDGIIRMTGLIAGGSLNTAAFILPAGFRPNKAVIVAAVSNFGAGSIQVESNGTVTVFGASNASFSLSVNFSQF